MKLGYTLSCEEYGPAELIEQAKAAERAGFEALWISDHFHPWSDAQGQSPMVWPMIGALSQVCALPITTAVTCPIMRIHPVIIAQAAATSAVLTGGKFVLGVGTGEALNEHILGDHWPSTDVRLAMLDEAVDLIRRLWTGEFVNHHGEYYVVEQARIYTLPDQPPKIYVSGFGPKSVDVAARIGDGYVSTKLEPQLVQRFRDHGGGAKPAQGGFKACYASSREDALRIAFDKWRKQGLPGELSQVLPSPRHFEQGSTLVEPDMVADQFALGPDPAAHVAKIEQFADAGYDEVYVASIGPHHRELCELYAREVVPRVRRREPVRA
ncbi:TIGR03557 family F420-dependent LLM class oxidoreductase [Planosporangium thailandense]|uniref:TIGR03557 family F420-dependent LLM class oxidoreductase n=1 Tax=Planosporangium thailandense TaxID=765197 RepID=A0ABX0Y197_9ACTN|nr:TIGR03557 family F420-dependent LLM class oxidoreductase [Planosporangium thailandense]NJC71350.1 TIGR03557 family F420-dependent LLM class oxidoreductase [Planosporangium thailandense]